ncbi:MAG: beta-propeller fold lactonase family protein [Armatimonadota bacterium]|nr:beta-propeller fold lactonase family protein [Armatimonadota bacterium]
MKKIALLAFAGACANAPAQGSNPLLFVTNNVGGTVSTFSRGTDGSLAFIGAYPAGTNPQDCGLSLDGRNLVVINATAQTTEDIYTFVVNADGSLTRSEPPSTITDGPLSLAVSATNFALIPSATGDSLTSFEIIGDNTTFVQSVPAGTFPSKILAAPNSRLAFLTDSSAREIRTFTLSETGLLQQTDIDVIFGGSLQGLAIAPNGLTLYSSTALTNHVYWLNVDYANNAIYEASSAFSGGNSCVELAVHPQMTFLYVCNVVSDTLTVMPVLQNGGLSGSIFSYDIGNDIRDVVTDGRYVYVTDESSAFTSPVGVVVFRIESNGSLTRLDTHVTNGSRPQHMQLWDPLYTTLPYSLERTRGLLVGGTNQDTVASDDLRLLLRPGIVFSSSQAPVELTLTARSPFAEPGELHFNVESQTSSAGIRQEVMLYDWKADIYVEVDARNVGTPDLVLDVSRSDANRFIDEADQTVRAKIMYRQSAPIFNYPWEARIDRVAWTFTP